MMKLNFKRASVAGPLIGALVLTIAIVAFSQGHRGGRDFGGPEGRGGPGMHDGLGRMARDLNLTDDQQAQIKKIHESFAESTKSLHEQMRALHESEPDPFTTAFDETAVRAAAEARAKIDIELAVAHAKMMSQVGGVLTTEQKAQLASRRQERRPPPPPPGE
jgi:Spy/CpxP family protein refolding chaperone